MKVLFLYTVASVSSDEKPLGSSVCINFGISYISSFLKRHNHSTELLILSKSFGDKNIDITRKKIEDFKPEIIGFYSLASQYKFISDISKFIKSNYPEIFLIVGGPHATLNPEVAIKDSFDAVCIGEGERPMLELSNALEKNSTLPNINNLWIKKGNLVEKNQITPFFEDLDSLPFPDRTMWGKYIDESPDLKHRVSILLGRGCPHSCTYCCNHALRKITSGKYVRYRSPQNIIDELRVIHKKYPLEKAIYLEVESFNLNEKWAIKVCNELEKYNKSLDNPLSFGLNIRITPNVNLDTIFNACRKANILDLNIGLESGSERIRKDILRRNYSNNDVLNTINSAKIYGLNYNFYILIGLPGETIEDIKETIKICRIYQPAEVIEHIFYPYPGTDLYALCKKMNILNERIDVKEERTQAMLNMPDLSKRQIQRSYIWFNYNVYKGYKNRIKLLLKVLLRIFSSNNFIYSIASKSQSILIIKLKKYINSLLK